MGTRYGPIEYREKDHYDIDQKLLSVDHCESMSYFGDFNHIVPVIVMVKYHYQNGSNIFADEDLEHTDMKTIISDPPMHT